MLTDGFGFVRRMALNTCVTLPSTLSGLSNYLCRLRSYEDGKSCRYQGRDLKTLLDGFDADIVCIQGMKRVSPPATQVAGLIFV